MPKPAKIFEPGNIGKMAVKNRIVMAPLGLRHTTDPNGFATERLIRFYEARARGGVGHIQLSTRAVNNPSAVWGYGILSLIDDEHIESARHFTSAIQAHGTKVSFSMNHPGVRLSERLVNSPPETRHLQPTVMGPSNFTHPITGWTARAFTKDELAELVERYGQAAARGKMAGFDAVRIQACHGYLLSQFLSPRVNRRTDEYGGSTENRCRFVGEVISRVRQEVGPDYPIILRINGDDFIEGGINLEESVQQARILSQAGIDALDISSGPRETHHWQFVTMYQPSGALVHLAAAIKKAVSIPVITAGKIDLALAERILEDGSADFINIGRPLLADPDLVNKYKAGKQEEIIPCIYCNQCRDRPRLTGDYTRYCSVNPMVGRELEYKIEPAPQKKKVMVVGGGLAGMQAAKVLAERGHDTTLCEAGGQLGGQWNILASYRPELKNLTGYLSRQLPKAGVKVNLNRRLTSKDIYAAKPDAVVIATGARPVVPVIPVADGKKVVLAGDVLTGKAEVGQEVVVVGGRLVGLDTALFLAEKGKKVSVVEMNQVAWGIGSTLKLALMEQVIKLGIFLYTGSVLHSVTESGAYIVWGDHSGKDSKQNEMLFLKADTVVIAIGSRADNRLGEEISGLLKEVYMVGDCVEPRNVMSALHEGMDVALKI